MLEIMTIIGARPQFIKAAILSRRFRSKEFSKNISETIVHTGQHYDKNMSEIFFQDMEIPRPDYNLEIGSGNHGATTGIMLEKIENIIIERMPNIVLVYGDTNSTFAGALAASKLGVPIAHVEAGLRIYMMSVPEEQNRVLTDHISTWLFCPSILAVNNLKKEGIPVLKGDKPTVDRKDVIECGDIMYEGSLYYRAKAMQEKKIFLSTMPKDFFLITIHRAENTDSEEKLTSIVEAINKYKKMEAIFPIHPRTKKMLIKFGLKFESHVRLIDPVGYFEMIALENACSFVLTDSGGVQKEAYFYRKPCITMQDLTGWIELVENGWNTLVSSDKEKIFNTLNLMPIYGKEIQLYGDGKTSRYIAERLLNTY